MAESTITPLQVRPAGEAAYEASLASKSVPVPSGIWIDYAGERLALSAASTVQWKLQPGINPWVSQLIRLREPIEEWAGKVGAGWATLHWGERTFEKLRVLRFYQTDPWHAMIRLADRRHRWRYVRYFGRHNWRRKINSNIRSGGSNQDDLRTVPEYRYRKWTVNPQTGKPFTARELVFRELQAILDELGEEGPIVDDRTWENRRVCDRLEYLAGLHTDTLGYALGQANLQVTIDDDGTIRVYDPFAIIEAPEVRIKGGSLRKPALARITPKIVEAFVLAEREKKITNGSTSNSQDTSPTWDPPNEIGVRNVLKLPRRESIGGFPREVGTWVGMDEALRSWGIAESDVQAGIFVGGEKLLYKYARKLRNGRWYNDPIWARRIQAVLEHYRSSWQLDPKYRDTLVSWKCERVAVIDPANHRRQQSPVYAEWYELYPGIPLVYLKDITSAGDNRSSWEIDPPQDAPAYLAQEDVELGILRIGWFPSINGAVAERHPGNIKEELLLFDPGVRQVAAYNTRQVSLTNSFRFESVITVVEGTPNDKSVHHKVVVDFSDRGGLVPKLQIFVRSDTARFDVDGRLVNKEIIETVCRSEAASVMDTYRERPVGVLTCVHNPADVWKISGNLTGITFKRAPNGSENVVVEAIEPASPPNAFRYMDPTTRAWLQRMIPTEA